MPEKFGLEFRIVDTTLLKELRRSQGIHTNPWTHFPRLIVSVDWLKRDTPMRMMRDALPPIPGYPRRFDILVVDEAHNSPPPVRPTMRSIACAPTRSARSPPPFRAQALPHRYPHNGYPESFSSLLELLDDQRFACGIPPERDQLATVMVRRLKDDIVDWNGQPKFAKRTIHPIEVGYTDDEQRAIRLLAEYAQLREKAPEEEGSRYATHFVLKLLKKRLFSSPAAFALTLDKHVNTLQKAKEEKASKPSIGILRRAIDQVDEEYADDNERETAEGEAVGTVADVVATVRVDQKPKRNLMALLDARGW